MVHTLATRAVSTRGYSVPKRGYRGTAARSGDGCLSADAGRVLQASERRLSCCHDRAAYAPCVVRPGWLGQGQPIQHDERGRNESERDSAHDDCNATHQYVGPTLMRGSGLVTLAELVRIVRAHRTARLAWNDKWSISWVVPCANGGSSYIRVARRSIPCR